METKRFTQFGTFSVLVMLPLLIFFIVMIFLSGFDSVTEIIIFSLLILTFLICLLIFYKLSISVDNTHLSFKFGIGLFRKKYSLSEIESCKPVRNPAWYGIGIRLTPNGWLYNVSGLHAIELTFKNKKSKIRIGTDKPEEVSQVINNLLGKQNPGFVDSGSNRSGYIVLLVILFIAIALPAILVISGKKDSEIDFNDTSFEIKGMYGMTINYSDIVRIDTISILPRIKTRTNGYAYGGTLKGNFKLYDQTRVKLFIRKGIDPYILIHTNYTRIYLNFTDPLLTIETYKKISNKLKL